MVYLSTSIIKIDPMEVDMAVLDQFRPFGRGRGPTTPILRGMISLARGLGVFIIGPWMSRWVW